ncbi:MAG: Clp protease ClpP [Lachnospiraceae bacterium]|nr:Clp protease ClpP [Lachnospiraceae bacterium]
MKNGMKYSFRQEVNASGGNVHKLYVYDSIRARGDFDWREWEYEESETSAKYFRDRLDEIPDGETIELHVNSAGGEVGEGVTIFNLLKQKRDAGSTIIGYVDGMAYSVAMDIIMAATEIHMGLGTTMFLHNPWMYASGNAEQLRNYADQLDALALASQQLYLARSGGKIEQEELADLMNRETMLDPESCLKYGFCDMIDDFKATGIDDDPDDDPDDDDLINQKVQKRFEQELKEMLARQQEINKMLLEIKVGVQPKMDKTTKPTMSETFAQALRKMEVRK